MDLLLLIWFALLILCSTDSLLTAPLLFDACLNLGSIHRLLKELSKAEQLYKKAWEIAVSMKDFDKETLAKIHLAICLLDRGELKEAIDTYFEPLMVFKTTMRTHTRALYLHYYGGVCRSAADWGRAKEYLREALDLAKEVKDVGLVSSCCGELGNVFRSEGRYIIDHVGVITMFICSSKLVLVPPFLTRVALQRRVPIFQGVPLHPQISMLIEYEEDRV